jgi:hypothetical protein
MTTLQLNDWDESTQTIEEHLLRVAARYIASHGKEAMINFGHPEDEQPLSRLEFQNYLLNHADDMRNEKLRQQKTKKTSMEFTGQIIQAGGKEEPTVTIKTSTHQLSHQPLIPFYRQARITITPHDS